LIPASAFVRIEPAPSERLCDLACGAFATWTLASHATVAAGGSLWALLALFALAAAGALGLAAARGRRRAREHPPARPPEPPLPPAPARAPAPRAARGLEAAGLALGLLALATFLAGGGVLGLWGGAVGGLSAALAGGWLRGAPAPPPARSGPGFELALLVLALLCVAAALAIHRPDIDDAFYVNLAVAAADAPGRPLLAGDTLHGVPGLPLHLPVYQLHSFELAMAALSLATGLPAIACFHFLAASVGAFLLPLATASLLRRLLPGAWLFATAALVLVLLAAGESHRFYSNFALVRMWQGKALALFVFLPLVQARALDFAARPSARGLALLAAAQVAALGASSSALWVAPAGALAALGSALQPTREGLRRGALGALASLYVLGAGLLVRGEMASYAPARPPPGPGVLLAEAGAEVLGHSRLAALALFAVAVGWSLVPPGLARRFACGVPLAGLVALLAPWTGEWVSANLTGPSYWRAFWALPVPLLLALLLTAPLRLPGAAGLLAGLAACAGFALLVPRYPVFGPENAGPQVGIRIGWPGLKVPEQPWGWARALHQSAPAGAVVVAPYWVARWVPTFHRSAHPLEVRLSYLLSYRDRLGPQDVEDRHVISAYAAGALLEPDAALRFRRGLEHYRVMAVCLAISELSEQARAILRAEGFERRIQGVDHEIWVRS
jgi:hypothetical protein